MITREQIKADIDSVVAYFPIETEWSGSTYNGLRTKTSWERLATTYENINDYAFSIRYSTTLFPDIDAIPKTNDVIKISGVDYIVLDTEIDSLETSILVHLLRE